MKVNTYPPGRDRQRGLIEAHKHNQFNVYVVLC